MATVYEPITKCPKCGSGVYDNRGSEKSPKSPQFKCKDKACAEAFWLKSPEDGPAKPTQKPTPTRHTGITLTALAEKMNEAYEVLQVNNIGESLITGDLLYKMAFTVLKDRNVGD